MIMSKKIAFIFPGQGSQAVGMGKAFYDSHTIAKETFQEADELLGKNLSKILFEGPDDQLKQTLNSQPAIYVTSMAILRVLESQFPDLKPQICAGHSLGEYTAITAGGWLSFDKCLPFVHFRAESMGEACKVNPGSMAAILGLDDEAVRKVVADCDGAVWAANFNCPGQVVISGTKEGIEGAISKAKEAGAKRALPLPVQGAFHSGLMQKAEDLVGERLDQTAFAQSGIPIVSNSTGALSETADAIKAALRRQITSSVNWTQSILAIEPVSLFVEIGNGKVLAGLNKKMGVAAPTISIGEPGDLEKLHDIT